MTRRTPMWRRYSTLFGRNIRSDIEEELRFHIEARARELIDAGWQPQAAEEEAHRLFGDRDSILAECQQINTRFEQRKKVLAYFADIATVIDESKLHEIGRFENVVPAPEARGRREQVPDNAGNQIVEQVELAILLIAHHRAPLDGWPDEEEETPQVSALPGIIPA